MTPLDIILLVFGGTMAIGLGFIAVIVLVNVLAWMLIGGILVLARIYTAFAKGMSNKKKGGD